MSHVKPATPRGRKARQRSISRNLFTDDELTRITDNITATYEAAAADLQSTAFDTNWYDDAHWYAYDLSADHGVTPRQAAGVLAALSPATDWDRNKALAHTMLASGDCSHAYGDAITKARRIMNGEDPYAVLGGRKVRSFFRNILYPERPGAVTIDRHAYAVAMYGLPEHSPNGRGTNPHNISDTERKMVDKPGVYAQLAACYRSVAREQLTLPHLVQAVTWAYYREHVYTPPTEEF